MNKRYLISLGGYLVLNAIIYAILCMVIAGPVTFGGFLFNTILAVVVHKYFIWKG